MFKNFEKHINEEDIKVDYYNECILINEKIKNILGNINEIKDKFDIDVKFFIYWSNQIFIIYKLKENSLICKGKLDENNILKIKSLYSKLFEIILLL